MNKIDIEKISEGNHKAYSELIETLEKVKDAINKQNFGIAMDILCKPYPAFQVISLSSESKDEKIRKGIIKYLEQSQFGEEPYSIDDDTVRDYIDWLEKQGEQKPTDKVEPKFKVEKDKWYVCTYQYCNCIEGRNYKASLDGRIIDDYGTEYDIHSDAYRWFRPWTIQDAKDGDVLVTKNKNIFIFKSISGCTIYDYCGLYFGKFMEFSATVNGRAAVQLPIDYTPATKEQRDLLFQKMHEAGYEWDADKKELKKIEQKPTEWSLPYGKNETAEKLIALAECLEADGDCLFNGLSGNDYGKFLRALAAIEQTQPKQEWSEEDEYCRHQLIVFCENCMVKDAGAKRCAHWLKSIKKRCTWKPSEAQMIVLNDIIINGHLSNANEIILKGLHEQLKKLREE